MAYVDKKMTETNMQVLRQYDGGMILQANVKPAAAQVAIFADGAIPAGRCCSRNSVGELELGVSGRRVPMWIWRRSDAPSTGSEYTPVSSATDLTFADGSTKQVLCFVGIEGLEIATTEYLKDSNNGNGTYAINALVSARMTSDSSYADDAARAAGAGKLFFYNVFYGAHAVVGVVSAVGNTYGIEPATGARRFGLTYLQIYTLYRPPVEGLVTGIPTNKTATP